MTGRSSSSAGGRSDRRAGRPRASTGASICSWSCARRLPNSARRGWRTRSRSSERAWGRSRPGHEGAQHLARPRLGERVRQLADVGPQVGAKVAGVGDGVLAVDLGQGVGHRLDARRRDALQAVGTDARLGRDSVVGEAQRPKVFEQAEHDAGQRPVLFGSAGINNAAPSISSSTGSPSCRGRRQEEVRHQRAEDATTAATTTVWSRVCTNAALEASTSAPRTFSGSWPLRTTRCRCCPGPRRRPRGGLLEGGEPGVGGDRRGIDRAGDAAHDRARRPRHRSHGSCRSWRSPRPPSPRGAIP